VPGPEFLFALELSDPTRFTVMIDEVAASVVKHAGLQTADAADIVAALRGAVADAASAGASSCDVQFRAHAGALELVVSGAGREWHMTRRLP
jgi:citrate lyase alpha subunit